MNQSVLHWNVGVLKVLLLMYHTMPWLFFVSLRLRPEVEGIVPRAARQARDNRIDMIMIAVDHEIIIERCG